LIKKLVKQPQFIIGLLFILGLLLLSFFHESWLDLEKETQYLYNEKGDLIKVAPLRPSDAPPFGTDMNGKHLFYQIIDGAKYTLLIALCIAIFRILVALLFSLINIKLKGGSFLEDIVQSTLYIPTAIIAYIFMNSLFLTNTAEPMDFITILVIQCLILIGVGVPPLVKTFSDEIKNILNKDYIVSTFSLGSNKAYIYFKHVLPELYSRIILMFAQQAVQTLILLAHLGVLAIFIGGSQTILLGDIFNLTPAKIPISGEWAGIIGHSYTKLLTAPWVILIPLAFFSLSILAINLIIQGIQNCLKEERL
jgi:peptide/nickel transport system permease protein